MITMTVNPNPDYYSSKLLLAAAVLRGVLGGATRAIVTWLIEEHTH